MISDNLPEGSKFVIIENVTPTVNGGQFPVKAVPGEIIDISADIFGYGNRSLAAIILFKNEHDEVWNRTYMSRFDNDCWLGNITVEHFGNYVFKIKAWVDPAATWQNIVRDRLQSEISIADLLPDGENLLEDMHKLAGKEDKALIGEALRILGDEKRQEEAGQLAISYRFTEWSKRYPNSSLFTETQEMRIKVYKRTIAFSSWYTLFPRSTSGSLATHGTFQDVRALLPRITDLGFDVLHFPPVQPIGSSSKRGKNGTKNPSADAVGSVYAIGSEAGGHDAVHPNLGSIDDLRNLISDATSFGIEIAMDLALFFSPDHPWVSRYPEWFGNVSLKPGKTESQQKGGTPDMLPLAVTEMNWAATKNAVVEIISCWVEWGIRIIRVNNPDSQPQTWWSEILEKCNEIYPEVTFYAGTFTRPTVMKYLAKSGFALSDSYFMWKNTKYELEQYIQELSATELKSYYKPIFWVNTHQINPYNLQSGHEPQHLVRFFLAATLAGCYGIYGPAFEHVVHEPFPGKEDYWDSEKYEIKIWDWKKETKLTYLISMINRLRKENTALQQTNNIRICESTHQEIIGYIKSTYQNHILCVANLDSHNRQSAMVKVPIRIIKKNNDEQYIAHDLITGARYVWKGEWNYVELDPFIMPFHLLRIEDYRPELDVH